MKGMSSDREETVPLGALLLNRLLHRMEPRSVVFSAYGVREGLLFSLLSPAEQREDPLIAACEEVACLRSRSPDHAHELFAWTAPLFAGARGKAESVEKSRLRLAACLLSDIAWRAHPDYRGEQSAMLIAQSALAGLDHESRAFLALAVYHRYARSLTGELLPRLADMLTKEARKRALVIGLAARLAHDLCAGMAGILPSMPLSCEEDRLVLNFPVRLAPLDGEPVRRRLRQLAAALRRAPQIRVAGLPATDLSPLSDSMSGLQSEEVS
jgi:exopolyphosphatase/guanosine-5'-triphosphate,3'-diphosphate pyrophosphatase